MGSASLPFSPSASLRTYSRFLRFLSECPMSCKPFPVVLHKMWLVPQSCLCSSRLVVPSSSFLILTFTLNLGCSCRYTDLNDSVSYMGFPRFYRHSLEGEQCLPHSCNRFLHALFSLPFSFSPCSCEPLFVCLCFSRSGQACRIFLERGGRSEIRHPVRRPGRRLLPSRPGLGCLSNGMIE